MFHLGNRRFCAVSQGRADLQGNVAIAAIAGTVQWQKQVAGRDHVFNHQLPEDFLRFPAAPGQGLQGRIIIMGTGDGVEKDGGVGGHPADFTAGDHLGQLAVFELTTLDVIQPEGLTEGGKLLNRIWHQVSLFRAWLNRPRRAAPQVARFSILRTFATRWACRSCPGSLPMKRAARKTATRSLARSGPITRAPRQSTFMSSCSTP